jgi:hypothetical protein
MALDPKKWTVKTQEAVAAAVDQAKGLANPQLTAEALHQIPDLPTLIAQRYVQGLRAVRACALAGLAIVTAPAEFPIGKGGEAFFSASNKKPELMYLV